VWWAMRGGARRAESWKRGGGEEGEERTGWGGESKQEGGGLGERVWGGVISTIKGGRKARGRVRRKRQT